MNEDTTSVSGSKISRSSARSGLTRARDVVADQIRNAAERLDERANRDDTHNERLAEFERNTARKFQMWSDRLNDWEIDRVDEQVRTFVRQRPAASLLTAAAIGLCIGLWLRKR